MDDDENDSAQNDIRDPTGSFWREMKNQDDSSDSGEKKSDASREVCRISIRCSIPEPSSSHDEDPITKSSGSPTKSPPIIVDDVDDTGKNSDDNQSQKSLDMLLDTSINPRSPTSSITSQRKLEWDSLADVGYANESDRKNSASSLSTLERLALKQQYSNSDTRQDSQLGLPTAHSTPLDETEPKSKNKKGVPKKTKIYKKDIDFFEVNIPQNAEKNPAQSINVNLTKHISFNVQRDGDLVVENIKKDITISPEKFTTETEVIPQIRIDREIQTSSIETKDKSVNSDTPKGEEEKQEMPMLITSNTLKKRPKKKKMRVISRKYKPKKKLNIQKGNTNIQEKSGEQLSEADSFEYMPGHMYNQNQLHLNQSRLVNTTAGNKSSLESSGLLTTDSSKCSKHSFKKDLEKSIDLLKAALQQRYSDNNLKQKLIKEVIQRLLKSRYRDDESTTEFLSGLSFKSKNIGLGESNPTTSTSEGNTLDKDKIRPKKSILRMDNFNSNAIASTSQSVPNIPTVTNSDKPFTSNLIKSLLSTNTETDLSSKEKISSENGFAKTSSEELYQKYLQAFKREEAYRKHLRNKELLLKQQLRNSESVFNVPLQLENKVNSKMKELMKDLIRNNYDDGSGDASKLEGSSNIGFEGFSRNDRSHSVFTLSSGHSEVGGKKPNPKKRLQSEFKQIIKSGIDKKEHYCCCPHHSSNIKSITDSSVQVNIRDSSLEKSREKNESNIYSQTCNVESGKNMAHFLSDAITGDVKYVCLCDDKVLAEKIPENYLIFKCSRLTNKDVQSDDNHPKNSIVHCGNNIKSSTDVDSLYQPSTSKCNEDKNVKSMHSDSSENISKQRPSKSSQTNLFLKMLYGKSSNQSVTSSVNQKIAKYHKARDCNEDQKQKKIVYEATRSVQTEISIHPQISDPCLSDINILSDMDCYKLVSEQCREVSRHSSDTDSRSCEVQSDIEICISNEKSTNCNLKESQIQTDKDQQNLQSDFENINLRKQCDIPSATTENFPDNFTIPIQGTNMMLMVSIGSNSQASKVKAKEIVKELVEIEKFDNIEESRLLSSECSNIVQIENLDVEDDSVVHEIDHNSNKIYATEAKDSLKISGIDEYSKVFQNKFSTYPKTSAVSDNKGILRSNTDTDIIKNTTLTQTDFTSYIAPQDVKVIDDNQKPGKSYTDSKSCGVQSNIEKLDQVCSCGCLSEISKCKRICGNLIKDNFPNITMIEDNNKNVSVTKQLSTTSIKDIKTLKKALSCSNYDKNFETVKDKSIKLKKDIATQKDLLSDSKVDYTVNGNMVGNTFDCFKTKENLGKLMKQESDVQLNFQFEKIPNDFNFTASNLKVQDNNIKDVNASRHSDKESDSKCDPMLNCVTRSVKEEVITKSLVTEDPILEMIKDITKRYSKTDIEKNTRKKCFKEIVTVLNYLLDTDEGSDNRSKTNYESSSSSREKDINSEIDKKLNKSNHCVSCQTKTAVDKAVQLTNKKQIYKPTAESSELPTSTDVPETSTDSAACKVLNKIKKQCEKYHQKRCKKNSEKICEVSSSTSAHCNQCRHSHHCSCRTHKCKKPKNDRPKKPVAYNLIIQTSESMISEETVCDDQCQPLKNIVVRVPYRYKKLEKAPFKEVASKIEQKMESQSPRCHETHRSRNLLNECETSSSGNLRVKNPACTIRDYLEKNRPDFVEKCSQRQNCLKYISESRNVDSCNACAPSKLKMIVVHTPECSGSIANCNMYCGGVSMNCNPWLDPCVQNMQSEVTRLGELILSSEASERAAHRDLLSLHVDRESPLSALTLCELRQLAKEVGIDTSLHKQPKLISEKEMKRRSEKIYKSLPEVVQKKEQLKKENIKKSNLLMANIFKKNLQKKTLRGSVNLSNYSSVVKI